MKRDCELPLTLEDLHKDLYDAAKLRELFARFGFKSRLKELDGEAPEGAAPAVGRDFRTPSAAPMQATTPVDTARRGYAMVIDEPGLRALALRLETASVVGFDTETDGLEPMVANLVGLSFAFDDAAFYVPVAHRYAGAPDQIGVARALEILKPWIESDKRTKVGQNLKFDAHILANHGVALRGIAHDTLLESYVFEVNERHDLETLARRHLGWETISYDAVTGKGASRISFAEVDVERATREIGGPIAHGYLTLSLIPFLGAGMLPVKGVTRGINYGSDKVRFINMVRVGKRVRMRQKLIGAEAKAGGMQLKNECTIEIEGEAKPACIAETMSIIYGG